MRSGGIGTYKVWLWFWLLLLCEKAGASSLNSLHEGEAQPRLESRLRRPSRPLREQKQLRGDSHSSLEDTLWQGEKSEGKQKAVAFVQDSQVPCEERVESKRGAEKGRMESSKERGKKMETSGLCCGTSEQAEPLMSSSSSSVKHVSNKAL